MTNRVRYTPLDVILSVVLVLVLGYFGLKWVRSRSVGMRVLGGVVLVILLYDVLQTAPVWVQWMQRAVAAEQSFVATEQRAVRGG